MSQTSDLTGDDRLARAWALASQKPVRGQQLRISAIEGVSRALNATLSHQGLRGILVPLQPGERLQIQRELRAGSTSALRAERSQFSSGAEVVDALHVWCVDRLCDDAFASFAATLIDRFDVQPIGDALEACYAEFVKLIG